jgi:tetratricopeptide (TPR) repeat protein
MSSGTAAERIWQIGRLLVVSALLSASGSTSQAAEGAKPDDPPLTLTPAIPALPGYPTQIGDPTLEKFQPANPETSADRMQDEALAWFMTAQVHYSRGESKEGLDALKKSVAKETNSLTPYKALVPALLEGGETDAAKKTAIEALKQRPDAVPLVQGVALFLARTERINDAIGLLEEALPLTPADKSIVQNLSIHREMGTFERLAGRADKAADHYRIVFEALIDGKTLKPDDVKLLVGDPAVTYDEFGEVFLLANQPDLALKAFDEAAKHRTTRPGIHSFNLATLFRQTKRPEESLAELDKYFKAQLQTKGRAAYQLLKDLLTELNRKDELLPKLKALAEDDPQNESLAYFLADEYLAADKLEEAKKAYQGAPGNPRDPYRLLGLLEVNRREKRYEELFKLVVTAYQTIPVARAGRELPAGVNPEVRELSSRFEAEVKTIAADKEAMDSLVKQARDLQNADPPKLEFAVAYVMGKLTVEADRADDALNFYKLAISMQNVPPMDLYQEITSYLLGADKYEAAISVLEEGIQNPALEQQKWVLQFLQSAPYEMLGETNRALALIGEARKQGQQAKNPVLRFREGWINYHAQRWETAIKIFEEMIASADSDGTDTELVNTCRFSLSAIYVHLGDYDKGEKILEEVLRIDPENTQANNDLGYLWADRNKNLDRAKEMVGKALAAEPDKGAYLDSMAWVLYRLGQYEEAKAMLLKATSKSDGQDATIWDHLADVYDKLGMREEAITTWIKALEEELEKSIQDEKLVKAIREKIPADRLPAAKEKSDKDETTKKDVEQDKTP